MAIMQPILLILLGYALGSIPFGALLVRWAGGGDIRESGSGNIGATNVLRTGNKLLALLTLLLDVGKGVLAVLIAKQIGPGMAILAGMGAFVGHLYPVWLGFRGGKGVATLIGIVFALHWPMGVIFLVVWLAAALLTRISSVGGLLGALSTPLSAIYFGHYDWLALLIGICLLVMWKHRGNIERLLAGTEPRIGSR